MDRAPLQIRLPKAVTKIPSLRWREDEDDQQIEEEGTGLHGTSARPSTYSTYVLGLEVAPCNPDYGRHSGWQCCPLRPTMATVGRRA
eukprot:366123-Chlamydomonas_euryale.AAC.8